MIWADCEFIAMVVGGPNMRTDFHINQSEEFFYQVEGDMTLRVRDGEKFEDVKIREGEIFLLPPKVPHSPQRPAHTVGLVIERRRRPEEKDALAWYCSKCGNTLYSETFFLTNIETQFKEVFDRYFKKDSNVTCARCGTKHAR